MTTTKKKTFSMSEDALKKLDVLSSQTKIKKSTLLTMLLENADVKTIMSIITEEEQKNG